jgi:hypothetical protein
LGTPHRGAHSAQLGVVLFQAAIFFGANWKKELLETLKYESKEVLNLDKEFAWISPSKELVCFYETKETPKMGLVRGYTIILDFSSGSSLRLGRSSLKYQHQFTDTAYEISLSIVTTLK